MKIAGILTCYNRVSKTEQCLICLSRLLGNVENVSFDLFVTNDGSTDGTREMLEKYKRFLSIVVIEGNGCLFWSGGMRKAWEQAIMCGPYDGYLWLNDDTYIFDNLFSEIKATIEYSIKSFSRECIAVGATCSTSSSELTYSGMFKGRKITPNSSFQSCTSSNGNIVYVPSSVVKKIGILDRHYQHAIGDIDYTYTAYKNGVPILLMRGFLGACDHDHKSKYKILCEKSISERVKYVFSPLGFQMKDYLYYQKKFWPWKLPLVLLAIITKIFFPKLEMLLRNKK